MERLKILPLALLLTACGGSDPAPEASQTGTPANSPAQSTEVVEADSFAVFAGGCFWCMEPPFDKVRGVASTISGYAGGQKANPTYSQVSSGQTAHLEVIQIQYDSSMVSFDDLLRVYWQNVDPLNGDGQFCDYGRQYRPAIFYAGEEQKTAAETSLNAVEELFDEPLKVELLPLSAFYPAEEYHQDFYLKNPDHYKRYRTGCRRDQRLNELWAKRADDLDW